MRAQAAMWEKLGQEPVDVLVIGGGINGAGIARDAANRGLNVALVEMRDLAYGTSSRSSKMVHGGLRYLEQFAFGLVFESVSERLTNRTAPYRCLMLSKGVPTPVMSSSMTRMYLRTREWCEYFPSSVSTSKEKGSPLSAT